MGLPYWASEKDPISGRSGFAAHLSPNERFNARRGLSIHDVVRACVVYGGSTLILSMEEMPPRSWTFLL